MASTLTGRSLNTAGWKGAEHVGAPIAVMVARVKTWLAEGKDVRVFTARANDTDCHALIQAWCLEHLGQTLAITATKDYGMVELWDDRCVQVVPNTGLTLLEHALQPRDHGLDPREGQQG